MLKDITIGQYYPCDSIIHRLDPRVKIAGTFAFMASLFIIDSFVPYALIILFLGGVIGMSKIPAGYVIKGLKPLIPILVLTLVINMFLTPGELIWSMGPLKLTSEGLRQGVFMVVRLIFLIIGTSILTLATSPIQLTDGIEMLLNPFKKIGVPAHELAMMMTIALRFIPTLLDETDKIMKAQMARGADFESKNLMRRAKNLVPLLVPLFISAFRRADELAMAMEARCYRGGENRTRMKQIRMEKRDYISYGIMSIYMAGIVASRWII
ncbi:energy-coupling factor transport system permease protein [Peptoclostridium litorale DSM 5388]|uniref:Energy-coupling factor transporter transmembrane protein EcfT n=1 Tax=Peptoclostridium litorale DSM 5388 TaxID=1121324 RepID=A0A069RJ42_PEPLI|nr:energy-coupling factor transporter transmembrane component T [Peptoclostridium litorale]KDR94272.1 energy-coupling factor transporter transmembrane protein EcfT [Peptoclostridium litorale DSM 5388]SIO28358.1 energy-coupling factor transport system permease protein [Peptoclostridium litorale DSM 5388]